MKKKIKRSEIRLKVNSIKDLNNLIIPHFLIYLLLSQKAADFYLFKQIIELILSKAHLTEEGLLKFINIRGIEVFLIYKNISLVIIHL